jgi:large subunit ribosomal protein L15
MEEKVPINLPKTVAKRAKRRGRGYSSGVGGHTVGRGQKGQKTRAKIHPLFEGLKSKKSLSHRLPQLRGKLKLKGRPKPVVVNIKDLEKLPAGSKVDIPTLVKYGLVDAKIARMRGVKILGGGELPKKLELKLPMSGKTAKKESIEKEKNNKK